MHIVLLASVLVLAGFGPTDPSPAPSELIASVKAYEAAANRHDWQALQPLIAENAVIELGDGLELVGRDKALGLHEWERAMGTETHYTDCSVKGESVTCRATEQNDFLRLAGLGPMDYTASTITFEAGRVVRMSATLSEESAAEVSRYMQPFLDWASKREPTRVATFLNSDGTFAFGFEPAMTFKRLLRVYAAMHGHNLRAL